MAESILLLSSCRQGIGALRDRVAPKDGNSRVAQLKDGFGPLGRPPFWGDPFRLAGRLTSGEMVMAAGVVGDEVGHWTIAALCR